MGAFPVSGNGGCVEIIRRSACEHDDLESLRLLDQQCSEPLHSVAVALHQLVVQDDRGAQVLRERQTIQRRQLLARSHRNLVELPDGASDEDAAGAQFRGELQAVIALPRQLLKPFRDRRCERLPEVARLCGVSFLQGLEQELPAS